MPPRPHSPRQAQSGSGCLPELGQRSPSLQPASAVKLFPSGLPELSHCYSKIPVWQLRHLLLIPVHVYYQRQIYLLSSASFSWRFFSNSISSRNIMNSQIRKRTANYNRRERKGQGNLMDFGIFLQMTASSLNVMGQNVCKSQETATCLNQPE